MLLFLLSSNLMLIIVVPIYLESRIIGLIIPFLSCNCCIAAALSISSIFRLVFLFIFFLLYIFPKEATSLFDFINVSQTAHLFLYPLAPLVNVIDLHKSDVFTYDWFFKLIFTKWRFTKFFFSNHLIFSWSAKSAISLSWRFRNFRQIINKKN